MPYNADLDVRVTDTSLRDGSHAKSHQFTEEDVRAIVAGLDERGRTRHRGGAWRWSRRLII